MTSLGIDVGGSSVKLALVRDNEVLWQAQSDTYAQPTSAELAKAIRKAIDGRFDPAGAAVGICVPGTRDRVKRIVIQSVNLPALNGLRLDDLVAEACGAAPTRLEVDR